MSERQVTFDLGQDAIAWLADKGYDERMGARPLGRVIQEHIKKPLAEELLFGKLKNGGTVKVSVADGKLRLDYIAGEVKVVDPKEEPEAKAKPVKPAASKTAKKPSTKKAPPKQPEPTILETRKPKASVPVLPKKK